MSDTELKALFKICAKLQRDILEIRDDCDFSLIEIDKLKLKEGKPMKKEPQYVTKKELDKAIKETIRQMKSLLKQKVESKSKSRKKKSKKVDK